MVTAGSDIAGAMQSTSHVPLACMFIDTVHDNTFVWYTTSHSLSLPHAAHLCRRWRDNGGFRDEDQHS